jgi:hypothetical protein
MHGNHCLINIFSSRRRARYPHHFYGAYIYGYTFSHCDFAAASLDFALYSFNVRYLGCFVRRFVSSDTHCMDCAGRLAFADGVFALVLADRSGLALDRRLGRI